MARRAQRPVQALLLLAVFALFAWGVVALATVRFEQGEPYAPYSSLRADPLGSRGLFGALDSLAGVNARRHLRPLSKLEGGAQQLVMVLGVSMSELRSPELHKELLRLADAGSRVVVAAAPPSAAWQRALRDPENGGDCGCPKEEGSEANPDSPSAKEPVAEESGDSEAEVAPVAPAEAETPEVADWQLGLGGQAAVDTEPQYFAATRAEAPASLPERLTIHTPLVFRPEGDAWLPVYRANDAPVVVERRRGAGSLVLFAESYLFSNESLRRQPPAELVAWLLGDAREVVFSETHLGVEESTSLMMLIRRYRMDGILMALFAIAALTVWKNAVPLVPPPPPAADGLATRDHFSGLINLLARHIPLPDLGEACHREWLRGLSRYGYPLAEKRQQIVRLVKAEHSKPGNERQPLALYRKICQILTERTWE